MNTDVTPNLHYTNFKTGETFTSIIFLFFFFLHTECFHYVQLLLCVFGSVQFGHDI